MLQYPHMNTYILYAFIAMVLWGLSDFLMQYCVRRIGRIATLAWVGIFGTIVLFPFVMVVVYAFLHVKRSKSENSLYSPSIVEKGLGE